MASLDDLKKRIASVKSTQKITKAMKMVAAAKLRKAQESAERGRPYSEKMNNIILNLSEGILDKETYPQDLIRVKGNALGVPNLFFMKSCIEGHRIHQLGSAANSA